MAQKIVVANWKMNNDEYSSKALTYDFLKLLSQQNNTDIKKILCVPFPFLGMIENMCRGTESVYVGAQNCSSHESGAYTGEVSVSMLSSLRVTFVIIGHSERRELFNEKDDVLLEKIKLSLSQKITPIFCFGEPLYIREKNQHIEFVTAQLSNTVLKLNKEEFSKVILAYEPIWAIGSGKTASLENIEEMHKAIRDVLKIKFGNSLSSNSSILYGGSVNSTNAQDIFSLSGVDGGLVGGASLDAKVFLEIVNSMG